MAAPRFFARPTVHASVVALLLFPTFQGKQATIPERLSDKEFWALSTELSEPAGYFRSDNLVSNEVTFQHVIPELVKKRAPGGVYLGVGPDQNFTYIAALKPKIVFIVDIRRLNVMQHLFYKSLFELAPDRATYASLLFARPKPTGLSATTPPDSLMLAYSTVAPDSALFRQTRDRIHELVLRKHGFPLTPEEIEGLDYVQDAFFEAGPELTYNFGTGRRNSFPGRFMPSYGSLMAETDEAGVYRSYLANEDLYRVLKDLEERNLIVPVTGDFGGPKALKAVGEWVRNHGATITAFYTSNVEQYLFQSDAVWRNFFNSVSTLPTDSASTFIRAIFNVGWVRSNSPTPRSITLLCPINTHVKEYHAQRIQTYYDVMQCPAETR